MSALSEGVSVEQVLALAPHVTLAPSTSPSPAPTGDPVWAETRADAKPTIADVERFINDVANTVDGRLLRRAYLTNVTIAASINQAAASIITVGAAATLISAAFPTKAGINDQASYSAELWARYQAELDALEEALDQALTDQKNPSHGGTSSQIRGTFREPTITDDLEW